MRKYLFTALIALLGTLGLGACNNSNHGQATTNTQATRPTTAMVEDAMKECLAKHPPKAAPASGQSADEAASDDTDNACLRATVEASTWQLYLQQIVSANLGNITNSPYVYFVPSGKFPENQGAIGRVQDSISGIVATTVLPGNMIAVAGPDSATTAQVLEAAFQGASAGSFKGVEVLFIGDKADEAAVQQALAPSGATFKFAQM